MVSTLYDFFNSATIRHSGDERNEDMSNLFLAIQALRSRAWFTKAVRDIRAFRIEQWSDFTAVVKS